MDDSWLFPPLLQPPTTSCNPLRFFALIFFMLSLVVSFGRLMVLMGSFLLFSKTVPRCSSLTYQHLPFIHAGSLSTFSVFLKRVTTWFRYAIILLHYFPAPLTFFLTSSAGRFLTNGVCNRSFPVQPWVCNFEPKNNIFSFNFFHYES